MLAERKGFFISFEGIDGCGKSTQINLLKAHWDSVGQEYVSWREPGATTLGERVRSCLLDINLEIAPPAELLLFLAARAQLVSEKLRPALEQGQLVLMDRYMDSTLAYQLVGRGLASSVTADLTEALVSLTIADLWPDVTILLDIDPEIAWKRREAGREAEDRMESSGLEFMSRVRRAYLDLSEQHSKRYIVVDGNLPADEIFGMIIEELNTRFGRIL